MKRYYPVIVLLIAIMVIPISCFKDAEGTSGCELPQSLVNYELIWVDEFESSALNSSQWTFDLGDGCDISATLCGWGNQELQYYTSRKENVELKDGKLVITAKQENPLYLGNRQYTSARLKSKNKGDWRYGRIDIRAKLPKGKGIWPAIWMLPTDDVYGEWPKSGEIDIMELNGVNPREILSTIHYGNSFPSRFNEQKYELESGTFADDFHDFTLLWNEFCIQFLVDGETVGVPNSRSNTLPDRYPFDQEFHLLLNVAVGGTIPGNPDITTVFPQSMEIDYVKVYKQK